MPNDTNNNEAKKLNIKSEVLSLKALSILVVDSSAFSLRLISNILKGLEFGKVITVKSSDEAISIITIAGSITENNHRMRNIDIIICDLDHERNGGQKFLKFIRSHDKENIHYLPFIMMSGYSEQKQVEQSRDWGANEFLAKPLSVNSIAARILSVIDRPRPFVRNEHFFGPDRRRKKVVFFGKERRHQDEDGVKVIHERE